MKRQGSAAWEVSAMHKNHAYSSVFAELIKKYIRQRRDSGFLYDNPAYWLFRFDQFCVQGHVAVPIVTKELFDAWSVKSPKESKTTQNNRLMALRCFCIHLSSIGIQCHIPHMLPKPEKHIPFLMGEEDIKAFFQEVNAYECRSEVIYFKRLACEYKVLFTLIFCCGLRISEACDLQFQHVDTQHGTIFILHSKGDKDRFIYLADDLNKMCMNYKQQLVDELCHVPRWLFPGRHSEEHILKTSVDRKFNEIWNRTGKSRESTKKPTVHSLRHGFVIRRMDSWMENDVDFQVMMPYLSQHLGHASPNDTYYYFHQVKETFKTIRRKDRTANVVIPEVNHG